jgi:hypothetical protein
MLRGGALPKVLDTERQALESRRPAAFAAEGESRQ